MFGFGGYKKHHARRNELFFFILHPFASLDSSHLPGPQGTDSKNDREREPDRTLPRDAGFSVGAAGGRDTRAACLASGPGGTHGQEGRGKVKCQLWAGGLWPSHLMSHLVLMSPERQWTAPAFHS